VPLRNYTLTHSVAFDPTSLQICCVYPATWFSKTAYDWLLWHGGQAVFPNCLCVWSSALITETDMKGKSHKIKNCTTFVSKHKIYDIVQVLIFKLTWIFVISVELTEALLRNKSVKRLVITTFWPCWISVDALSFQSLHVIVCLSSVSVMSCLTQLCPFFMSST